MNLSILRAPARLNYVGIFLTLGCNFRCDYCINRAHGTLGGRTHLSAKEWIGALNRLSLPDDLPVTLQGGEPSIHPGFLEILEGIREDLRVDLLTNLSFELNEFMNRIPPTRFLREAPYAPIRVTYHPEFSDPDQLLEKTQTLLDKGYPVGLFCIQVPGLEKNTGAFLQEGRKRGIDCREKEFLGTKDGRNWGSYNWDEGVFDKGRRNVFCRTSELLISPDGGIFRCHRDLYRNENSLAFLHHEAIPELLTYRPCSNFGDCNPCDLKTKTNRFQESGHCSVDIRFSD